MLIHIINGLVTGGSYVLIALGLTLIFGILDVINLAHGEVYMIGAFILYIFFEQIGMSYWSALVVSVVTVAVFGVIIEKALFKPLREAPLLNTLLVSIAFAVLLQNVMSIAFGSDPKVVPTDMSNHVLRFFGISLTVQRLLVLLLYPRGRGAGGGALA